MLSVEGNRGGSFCATDACGAVLQPACVTAVACPDDNKPRLDDTSHCAGPFGIDTPGSAVACAAAVVALDVLPADTACCDAAS